MKGKKVLIPFPFTNLTITKLRPALALLESEKDVVVAFITHTGKPFKLFILQPSHNNFLYAKKQETHKHPNVQDKPSLSRLTETLYLHSRPKPSRNDPI